MTIKVALAGAGAGVLSNGIYGYKIVNKREGDSDTVRTISWELIVFNADTGADVTWPEDGFETLIVTDDI